MKIDRCIHIIKKHTDRNDRISIKKRLENLIDYNRCYS